MIIKILCEIGETAGEESPDMGGVLPCVIRPSMGYSDVKLACRLEDAVQFIHQRIYGDDVLKNVGGKDKIEKSLLKGEPFVLKIAPDITLAIIPRQV